ncbi:YdbH domain-containing protein [Opitutales bacterium]|nr:YdbH domain-containing protein [Opitutales bacterium]
MKKRVSKLKLFLWVTLILSGSLVFVLTSLPSFLESGIRKFARDSGINLHSIIIDEITPWSSRVSGLSSDFQEGKFSLQQLDLRYEPTQLAQGQLRAVSLTSPLLEIDIDATLERLEGIENANTDSKIQADELLSNPPVQHLRFRDLELSFNRVDTIARSQWDIEGDFHPGLAQLRLDGNLTGLPWQGDLTLVQEGSDLFLGASLQFSDLSKIFNSVKTVSELFDDENSINFEKWLEIEQGVARARWTGRLENDGIMDQFIELNATELVCRAMGLTLQIPQAILFVTPHISGRTEANFYANLNWGENLEVRGLKLAGSLVDGQPNLNVRVQRLRTQGVLPQAELFGLVVDGIEFAENEMGEFLEVRKASLRFSSLHLEEGMYNLYDGEIDIEWLGEDRFQIELRKGNGSVPTLGLNLQGMRFSGEIALDSLPRLSAEQRFSVDEIFLGEDQKIDDFSIEFKSDSLERFELSELNMLVNDFQFSLSPANLIIEIPESSQGRLDLSFLDAELKFDDFSGLALKKIQGNIKFNSLDPLDTNGSQSVRFDLHAGEQVLESGQIKFEVLPNGEQVIKELEIHAFGGTLALEETKLIEGFEDFELKVLAKGLDAQQIINCFEDLDARMEGNLSGILTIRNDPSLGWDFYGGSLSLDSSERAKLFLNTHGMLTEGLDDESSEYKNMYLLERALEDLNLNGLNIMFKLLDAGERIVEMNVRGESEVDGKDISVEYRPKIMGGLDALLQQADLSKWGVEP